MADDPGIPYGDEKGYPQQYARPFLSPALAQAAEELPEAVRERLEADDELLRLSYTALERSTPRLGDGEWHRNALAKLKERLGL